MDKMTDKEIGEILKAQRRKAKISQDEIAKACHASKNHISVIERGVNKCTLQLVWDYCIKLNMSLDELLMIKKDDYDNVLPELKSKLRTMSADEQNDILKIIKIIKK